MPADLVVVLGVARQVYGAYGTLKSFVEDEMATFLRDMGERQYDAAVAHLENGTRTPERMNDYTLLAIDNLENAYRTLVASEPTGFRLWARKHVIGAGSDKRAGTYSKACATALLQSMCYRYLKDENNARVYLDKAKKFFEEYAEAASIIEYRHAINRKLGLVEAERDVSNLPSNDEIRMEIYQRMDEKRKALEALSG
jgi:hypothetical protein